MINEANSNDQSLECRRVDLEARIARARDCLNFVDLGEREAALNVAVLRAIANGNGPRSERRKAGRNAQRIEATIAKSTAAVRTSARAVLHALQKEIDGLTGVSAERSE